MSDWLARPDPDQNPDGLIDYAVGHVRGYNRYQETKTNPRGAMQAMGLQEETRDTLLDPADADVRNTESLMYWIVDTLKIRYKTIAMLNSRLKRAVARGKRSKKVKRESINITSYVVAAAEPVPEVSATVGGEEEAVNAILPRLPASHIAVGPPGPILDHHVVLYKGKSAAELGDEFIMPDGELNHDAIRTAAGGDFNAGRVAWYWTEEEEVAEKYRAWGAKRNKCSESWIIRIQIPTAVMARLHREELYFSPEWKEYIWLCKKGRTLPAKFDKFAEEADVMVGHICSVFNNIVTDLKKEEVQSQITGGFLFYLRNGTRATQTVIMKDRVAQDLAGWMRGKTHIAVTAPIRREQVNTGS